MLDEAIRENRAFDLVLMDWKMPEMDGLEASRRIKQDMKLPHIPVIIMITAYGHEEVMKQAASVGLEGFLIKPASQSALFNTILEFFGKAVDKKNYGQLASHMDPEGLKQIRGARILLVEDNDINQQVAMELLTQMGLIVDVAGDGQAALEAWQADAYDLVLMDIQMPVMDGLKATRLIREMEQRKRPDDMAAKAPIPVVAMTAHAMSGDRDKSLAAGMNDHITKPIDPKILFETMVKWISSARREATREAHGKSSAPPPFSGEAMPAEMPGISIRTGLMRAGQNEALYRRILKKFYLDYRDTADNIKQAVGRNETRLALHLAHTLKGVSGNIGARELQTLSGELESAIRQADSEMIDDRLQRLDEALKTVFGSLKTIISEQDQPKIEAPQGQEADPGMLRDLLIELKAPVRKRQPRPSQALMAEIDDRVWPHQFAPQIENLGRLINTYRFREAMVLLESILDGIETGNEP